MATKEQTAPAKGVITRLELQDGVKVSLFGEPTVKLAVALGYDVEYFAEDRLQMREVLAGEGYTAQQIDNMEMIFSNDPDLLCSAIPDVKAGFETTELGFWKIWVDASASTKWPKMSNRSRYNLLVREVSAKYPELMNEFTAFRMTRSKTEPKQHALNR